MRWLTVFVVASSLASVSPSRAGFEEGRAAYMRGDFKTALQEWLPLAENGLASAHYNLGLIYVRGGRGAPQDFAQALGWFQRAAEQGHTAGQHALGLMYAQGKGTPQDFAEAVMWWRKAADQGYANAQFSLGLMYFEGQGVSQNHAEGARWFRKAAEQNLVKAQTALGAAYVNGQGVPQDYVQAHMWLNLAAARGNERAQELRNAITESMLPADISMAQELAREWLETPRFDPNKPFTAVPPVYTGSGFMVSREGHVLTNYHVIKGCREIFRTALSATEINAQLAEEVIDTTFAVLAEDAQNDLALLKHPYPPAAIAVFRTSPPVRAGEEIMVVGYPLQSILGAAVNVTSGSVSATTGPDGDPRFLQITAPVQGGNSGGPLVDMGGRVVGIVVAKLDALKVAEIIGDLPQLINFAIDVETVRQFLDANDVSYETAAGAANLTPADVAARALAFTLRIDCRK